MNITVHSRGIYLIHLSIYGSTISVLGVASTQHTFINYLQVDIILPTVRSSLPRIHLMGEVGPLAYRWIDQYQLLHHFFMVLRKLQCGWHEVSLNIILLNPHQESQLCNSNSGP